MNLATSWRPSFVAGMVATIVVATAIESPREVAMPEAPPFDSPAIAGPRIAPARTRILYVTEHADALSAALAPDHDMVIRPTSGLPAKASELAAFDLLIVSDVPYHLFATDQIAAIVDYASQGGAVLVVGGTESFGTGAYQATPLEKLLPVNLDGGHRQLADVAVVLVADPELSPAVVERSTRAAVETLSPGDLITVLAADRDATVLVRPQRAANRQRISAQLASPRSPALRDRASALREADFVLDHMRAAVKHVIVMSESPLSEPERRLIADSTTLSVVPPQPRLVEADLARAVHLAEDRIVVRARPHDRGDLALGKPPALRDLLATRRKVGAEVMLESANRGEPILARWCHGRGAVLAWTSDVGQDWAADWPAWRDYATFWTSVVRSAIDRRCIRAVR